VIKRLVQASCLVLALSALSGQALAGLPVEINPNPMSHGTTVTLADLFDDATGPAGTVVVGRAAPVGMNAVLDAAQVQLAARAAGLDWNNERGVRRVVVASSGATEPRAQVRTVAAARSPRSGGRGPARTQMVVADTQQVLVYARNISPGEAMTPDDLVWADTAPGAFITDPLADPQMAEGKAARRPLRAGTVAMSRDLMGAKMVHRDELVFVTFKDEGMSLTLQARALSDGGVGEVIQLMNPVSKKIVEAVVSGQAHAVIGPEAENIRAAAQNSNRYASVR
jgi:flagella basal body P-ring formation protein FlgA